jgi:hypothetical protein
VGDHAAVWLLQRGTAAGQAFRREVLFRPLPQRLRRAQSGLISLRRKTEVLSPPIKAYTPETEVHKVTWSGPVLCHVCERLTKTGFTMTKHGSSEWWRV